MLPTSYEPACCAPAFHEMLSTHPFTTAPLAGLESIQISNWRLWSPESQGLAPALLLKLQLQPKATTAPLLRQQDPETALADTKPLSSATEELPW